MYKNKRILGVIPARGGSVGVPKKNRRVLGGKPLLAHTIEHSQKAEELDLLVLSTDSQEIAAIGHSYGIRVVDRPSALATSEARTEPAIIHSLDELGDERPLDYGVLLEPTSPFRRPETISKCIKAIVDSGAPSLVTVCETRASLGRLIDSRFVPLTPGAPRRRQEREPLFCESSTLYIVSVEHLRETGSLVAENWLGVEVPENEAIDINTILDFHIAEAMFDLEMK